MHVKNLLHCRFAVSKEHVDSLASKAGGPERPRDLLPNSEHLRSGLRLQI